MKIKEKYGALLKGGRKRLAAWGRTAGARLKHTASRGQSFMIWAVAFLGLIGFVGFVVDTGLIYLHQIWLGQAVDAASLAAGYELPNIRAACARAVEYLEANGYAAGPDFSFQIVYPEWPDAPDPPGDPGMFMIDSVSDNILDPDDCASVTFDAKHTSMHFEVEISASQQISLMFMHLLGFGNIRVEAPSLAERSFIYDIVLILDRSGSMRFDTCYQPRADYGCENRYDPCAAPFFSEDFEDDNSLGDVVADGWVITGDEYISINFNPANNGVSMRCFGIPPLEDPDPFVWDVECVDDPLVVGDEIIVGDISGDLNVLLDNCTVTGNINLNNGHLYVLDSEVQGNLKLTNTWLKIDGSYVTGMIDGNTTAANPDLGYIITNNTIDGNVKIAGGGYVKLVNNVIGTTLDINCPTSVIQASGNTVDVVYNLCAISPTANCSAISRQVDTRGYDENVALFFTIEEHNLNAGDALNVLWRPNSGFGWSQIAQYAAADIPDAGAARFGVMLPSAAWNNANFQVRFETDNATEKWLTIDNIELRTCTDRLGPWIWNRPDNTNNCWNTKPITCETDDWDSLNPGVSTSGDDVPMANFMEQPMTDTLLAAETFIDLIDSRRPPMAPRNDQIGLVGYESVADKLLDLTTDYEAIKNELFTNFRAFGGTNLGGGMRVGLDILASGRWNSTHYMILLTDGWPNFYDDNNYTNPTRFGRRCPTNDPCRESLMYIDAQIEQAILNNVTIFTIGLGAQLDVNTFSVASTPGWADGNYTAMDLLERIAERTNGQAYLAPTSEELQEIFSWIAEAIFIRIIR